MGSTDQSFQPCVQVLLGKEYICEVEYSHRFCGKNTARDTKHQAWKFCIFGEPGSEPKKVQEPKKRGREKGRKGDKRKERRRRKQIWHEKSKERSRKEKKGTSYTKPNQTVGAKKNRKRKG